MRKNVLDKSKGLFFFLLVIWACVSCEKESPDTAPKDPTADFSFTIDTNNPLIVTFSSTTENAVGVSWDFGDGSEESTERNPVHIYSAAGSYDVTLTAIGDAKNAEVVKTIVLEGTPAPPPVASFNYSLDESNPLVVIFSNTSQNSTGYEWDFGDDTGKSTENSPSYTYTEAGTYQVTLTAVGPSGENSTTQSIVVGEAEGTDPVNLIAGSEMNPEDADKWIVKHWRSNQLIVEFNGKMQVNMTPGQPPNSVIYQVVNLEPGKYKLNGHMEVTGITNGWIEWNVMPGSEMPGSDIGATHKVMGWTSWCGGSEVTGYIADIYCPDQSPVGEIIEINEAGPYMIAVKIGFSNNSSAALSSPILIDDITLVPVTD